LCRELALNERDEADWRRALLVAGVLPRVNNGSTNWETAMSQQTVGIVINRLLTDEDLRIRFIIEPVETLADLHARGFELTPQEIDLFIQTNTWTWFWTGTRAGSRVH
jgi:hypothetical protein